ncbi:hypothetical protein ILYODFUR_032145 [Ilyodon furcidens]|uniref:Uncharacterized protein n=1 Tax=Ilyodon furcidens TaxID=33524 RepID=A0ABV0UYC9_9TELE
MVKLIGVISKGRSEFVQEIQFQKLTPGSVIVFRVSLDPKAQELVGVLRFYLSQFSPKYRRGSVPDENPPEVLQKPLAQSENLWKNILISEFPCLLSENCIHQSCKNIMIPNKLGIWVRVRTFGYWQELNNVWNTYFSIFLCICPSISLLILFGGFIFKAQPMRKCLSYIYNEHLYLC